MVRVKKRFKQVVSSSENKSHQGVIVHNQQEMISVQKDSTLAENGNEVCINSK